MSENKNKELLLSLGLISEDAIEQYSPCVRDRDDVGVLIDKKSGVIFLDRSDHMDIVHYEEIEGGNYWGAPTRAEALKKYADDDGRRFKQFTSYVKDKDVVDVGCGTGGFIDLAALDSKSIAGVEPQKYVQGELSTLGYTMYHLTSDLPKGSFDVATMFHTLEHITEPIEVLKQVKESLRPGGLLIVEVPHARDALFSIKAFQDFTLWSEHLILHTKESLRSFLEEAGFVDIEISGYQRYPLSNHAGWLINQKPGGQNIYQELDVASEYYNSLLVETDRTDTLIAVARV